MPRDFAALYRAQAQARTAGVQNETLSLPPGYLVGYDIRLRQDYTVLITAGACNIGGRLVQLKDDHQLVDADWVAPKINSARHYYIYLSAAGSWFVDIVAPVWNNQYLYWEQPDTNWRAVGKIFLADGNIIFGIKEVEKNEQTVTVAPEGFTGRADYYCTGTDDQILINAAIRYLHEAYDGGECNLIRGTYHITSSILVQYDNITVAGETNGGSVVSSTTTTTNDYSIDIFGTVKNININGIKFSYSGALPLEYAIGSDSTISKLRVENIIVTGSHCGFYLSAEETIVSNCLIDNISITSGNAVGIAVGGTNTILSNNIVKTLATSDATGYSYGIAVSDQAIVTGNIVDSVSNSADATRSYALTVTGTAKNNIVTGNHIQNNSKYGIYIDSGVESVSLSGNLCYNNGSDTGIANTNSNNFYDGGTDTQVYSNSWQQPVAGEPTQGELKWLPQSTSTNVYLILSNVTTTAAWASCTTTGLLPVGTKSIYCNVIVQASSSAAGLYRHNVAFSSDYSATPALGSAHPQVRMQDYAAASGELTSIGVNMFIPVDSNRKFYHYAVSRVNASNCTVYVALAGYTI